MRIDRSFLVLFVAFVLGGCAASHERGGDGGKGEPCGPVTCERGQVCCDPSCGICGDPEVGCPAVACVDASPGTDGGPGHDAGPRDGGGPLCGETRCAAGERCCPGCRPDEGTCVPEDSPCPLPVCPPPDAGPGERCGPEAGSCGPGEYCDYPEGAMCGEGGELGTCRPRPESCLEPGGIPVCGCDGTTYHSRCEAHLAGTDVASEGTCSDETCAAMDARGDGACRAILGYAWDGERCRALSGCECTGTDCDRLFDSRDACTEAYRECIDDCRTSECPEGERCTSCWGEYTCLPDGAVC